ncbi:hypothetical protein RF11_06962 [Thelohanellus kitauei]|uniref:Uncharacterized protein n=1 Tax=Thelohanellus kitauei TaxID=669202 RepID=A0A0C2I9K2_THEKT|nr:hypothetical protein RF11_06962 [Thelohanellus kitauei]
MYVASTITSFFGSVVAIFGYLNPRFKKVAAIFVIGSDKGTFIYRLVTLSTIKISSDDFGAPSFLFGAWLMIIVFLALGIMSQINRLLFALKPPVDTKVQFLVLWIISKKLDPYHSEHQHLKFL